MEEWDVVGERNILRKPGAYRVVKIEDEDLIEWIARLNERDSRCDHVRTLGPHASAFVYDEADCDRLVGDCELGNFLRRAVFVDVKVVPGKARDVTAFRVFDADIEQDEIDLCGNPEFATPPGILRRGRYEQEKP